ncbi:MAG: Fe-S cluster assembly protein HesB [Thermoanaerobaculia bacterium]
MRTRLRLPASFSFDAVVRSHGWYDLPPFRYDPGAGGVLTTALAGREVSFRSRGGFLLASSDGLDRAALRAAALRVFSLDLDLSAFDGALEGEPDLRRALSRGGGRMLRAPSLFEDAVKILLTTNCSWEATRGMVEKLIAVAGEGGAAFPTPGRLARLSPAALRKKVRCGYRAEALSRFSRRVASGRLDLSRWEARDAPAADIREAILAEHGFGPYAAEGLLRILGRHDFLALDSWVRKQYRRLYPGPARTVDRAIARRYARFGGFKGLALWLELTKEWHEGGA